MPGLAGTVHTPVGTMQKKTAVMVLGGAAVVAGIVWYRQKKLAASAASTTTTNDGQIDPATGYPYGSAEDAAALASQDNYISAPATSGGGSSTIPNSNVGYTTNSQWVQAVIETMSNNGTVSDPTALSAALGKYITGAYVSADDSATNSLIQQALAVEGYPPVSGPNGYPPSINRNPPTPPTGTPSTSPVDEHVHIAGLRATSSTTNAITFQWGFASTDKVKADYLLVYKDNVPVANIGGSTTQFVLNGLKGKTTYKLTVRGVHGSTIGPSVSASAKTK